MEIILRRLIQLYAWNWQFKNFLTKNWLSWRVVFEGLGVQMAKTMIQRTALSQDQALDMSWPSHCPGFHLSVTDDKQSLLATIKS